jgi:hypothetical protein
MARANNLTIGQALDLIWANVSDLWVSAYEPGQPGVASAEMNVDKALVFMMNAFSLTNGLNWQAYAETPNGKVTVWVSHYCDRFNVQYPDAWDD